MSLDEAIAADEARIAAEARAAQQNRERLDAAFRRFSQLAVERGWEPQDSESGPGWSVVLPLARGLPPVFGVFVTADGTWHSTTAESMAASARRATGEGGGDSRRDVFDKAAQRARETASTLDAATVEATLARLLIHGPSREQ